MKDPSATESSSLFAPLIISLSGFLFGYNTSVISGALLFMASDFQFSIVQQELVVSTLLIGALLGALSGGLLSDRFGRRKALFLTLTLFFLGTVSLCVAQTISLILIGRFITGIATGILSVASPLYLAEISTSENRGSRVSLNQLMITIGILTAYIICHVYGDRGAWRIMFVWGLIPLMLQFIGLLFIAESPSWLLGTHKRKADDPQESSWTSLGKPEVRRALFVGIGLCAFQQLTGINAVIYYAPKLFQLAGFESAHKATLATLQVGFVNVVVTFFALWLIRHIGRRVLFLAGLIGMMSGLTLLSYSLGEGGPFWMITGSVMLYVSSFAFSLGPLTWLINSEIYPLTIRGRAMGISIFVSWICNYLISISFLSLAHAIGPSHVFWIYNIICLCALLFVWRFVPETRGKTFEEIQSFWKK